MCVRIPLSSRSIAGVPSSRSLPGPYYCTPPVCVPDVIGALAVWRQNNTKKISWAIVIHVLQKWNESNNKYE